MEKELVEQLAAYCHEMQWFGWMEYLFSLTTRDAEGNVIIPKKHAERWLEQMYTSYEALSEREKDSDRAEARAILRMLGMA